MPHNDLRQRRAGTMLAKRGAASRASAARSGYAASLRRPLLLTERLVYALKQILKALQGCFAQLRKYRFAFS